MKKLMTILLALLLGSCGPMRNLMAPDEAAVYDRMLLDEAHLKEAVATDPSKQPELDALQIEIAKVENEAVRRSMGPVWGALEAVPIVGPYMKWLGPFAGTLVIPLLNKRGRKHYWSMIKNITPGVMGSDGSRGSSPIDALLDAGRAFGILHSVPVASGG